MGAKRSGRGSSMKTVVTTMRNEAPFVLEWVAHQRVLGFDGILAFSNDCADGTDAMLDRLQQLGVLAHVPNPRRGTKPVQWTALRRAENHPYVKKADWVMVADVDEFLNIHAGAGRLDDLIAARPEARAFLLAWRMFGSGGTVAFRDEPVTGQFLRAAPDTLVWPWRAVQFKTLFRNDIPGTRLGVHKPHPPKDMPEGAWVDDTGNPVPRVMGTVLPKVVRRYALAQVNHYALGSVESFVVKSDRGKPNHLDQGIGLEYWLDRDFDECEDRSILRHAPALRAEMDALLADPELARLHRAGVEWRRRRFAELMLRSDSFYLHARILRHLSGGRMDMAAQLAMLQGLYRMRQAETARRAGDQPA